MTRGAIGCRWKDLPLRHQPDAPPPDASRTPNTLARRRLRYCVIRRTDKGTARRRWHDWVAADRLTMLWLGRRRLAHSSLPNESGLRNIHVSVHYLSCAAQFISLSLFLRVAST